MEHMPETSVLNQTLKGKLSRQKQQMLIEVSKNNSEKAGNISVVEAEKRYDKERANNMDQVNQYAKNFSEIADFVDVTKGKDLPAFALFANAIRTNAQKNLVKIQLKQGLENRMKGLEEKRKTEEAGMGAATSTLPKA